MLPGGISPKILYEKLAKSNILSEKISIMATDDRVVPFTSTHSNTRKIQYEFVNKIEQKNKPNLFKLYSEQNNEIQYYLSQLEELLKLNTPDFAFLGMGEDGHIAGIFNKYSPNHYCYDFKNKFEPYSRITISMNVFLEIKNIILYVLGKDKKKMLSSLLLKKTQNNYIPAKFLLQNNLGEKIIICDKEAAPNDFSLGESTIYL